MDIEFEAMFENIDKDDMRERLKEAGATLVRPEFLQKRVAFNLPPGNEIRGGWLRVRDEVDKVTMSLKIIDGDAIHDQREICIMVDNYENAIALLDAIGCRKKAFQESKRELWKLGNVEITIDEWPFIHPFVEVEGSSEKGVREASEKLGFDWNEALFGEVALLVNRQYGVPRDYVNNETPEIVFDGENPWLEWQRKNGKAS